MNTLLVFALLLLILPLLSLLPFGIIWIWQNGWALPWLAGVLTLLISGACMLYWLRSKPRQLLPFASVQPDPRWPDSSSKAWQKVTEVRDSINSEDISLDDYPQMLDLGLRVMETVAHYYYPDSRRAELEIPIPYVLKIIEKVSRDMRDMLDNIPFSHVLTLHDLKRGQQAIDLAKKSYKIVRAGQVILNPVQAVLHETQTRKAEEALQYQADDLKDWLIHSYIDQVGYYAIALYSGELTLDEVNVTTDQTAVSRKDRERFDQAETTPEPIRILVLGQINAGKSSLINALFGELRTPVDTLALTEGIIPYVLQREGLDQMLIFDTAGYQESACEINKTMRDAISHCDLVLMVCSAVSAARNADRLYLDALRDYYREHPDRRQPPILTVLSHIDRLRPKREWRPPYNIVTPDCTKSGNIRKALETVAEDLALPLADIIPANLLPVQRYNIDEGIIPAILNHLDSAQHSRYLRCLRNRQKMEFWQHLRGQAINMGTILIDKSATIKAKWQKMS